MKKLVVLITIVLSVHNVNAQNCFWADDAGSTSSDAAKDIATDKFGNVYVTGSFAGPLITFGSVALTGSSGTNFYVAKYNAAGIVQWAKTATGIAEGYGITTDLNGNVLVSGYFDGASSTFSGVTLTNTGGGDGFVLKYNNAGTLLWAKSIGAASGTEYAYALTCDLAGAVYTTGRFTSSTLTIGSNVLVNQGTSGPDAYIVKMDSLGNVLWADGAGGNFNDIPNGITNDNIGGVYMTGSFNSNSITFGTNTLLSTGQTNMFLTKYDSTGTVIWAKNIEGFPWGDVFAFDINAKGSGLYIQGEFHGDSLSFGNDTIVNNSAGSSDVFTAKYDLSGNAVWGLSAGGGNYDYSRGITTDTSGNVYTTGYFSSTNFSIGDTVLIHAGIGNNSYVAKYNDAGTFVWAQKVGAANTHSRAIAAGLGYDVYFAGDFVSAATFGTTTLNSLGSYDIFVADIFEFNSGISSVINASCFGSSDGEAFSYADHGHLPYSYLWNTTPTQNTVDATAIPAGNYSVLITDAFGCAQLSDFTILEASADSVVICMVTVDDQSQYNIITWDKSSFTNVDSFIVYREISTANFQPIAAIPFDSLSQFIDTVSTLYFPNTGNPNVGTYRYKIAAKSSCGTIGPKSPYHNTIFIVNTGGTFTWPQLYEIEGATNPVISYVLMRDDLSNGNWNAVGSVAGTQSFIIDPQYSTYQLTASWRVETVWSISCTPTKTFNTSFSNKFTNSSIGIEENNIADFVKVYPNPSSGQTTISYSLGNTTSVSISIYNEVGQLIETIVNAEQTSGVHQYDFNVTNYGYNAGTYYLQLIADEKIYMQKIVIIE